MRTLWLMVLLGGIMVNAQRRLALPDARSCANRVRHATYRDARGVGHSYFFSWEHQPTRSLEVDWLDARNICRRHCMDAVSLETPQENEFIKQRLVRGNVRFIWTSGRKCNFNGCDRPDLQPQNINGWFWSGSGAKIGSTTQRNSGDWSNTGGYGQPQPDNREAAQGNDESCLSILNNFYNDGVKWHDVACHHRKPFVCEDSDELLNFVLSRNPGIRL
ncbi:C-type lectin 5 isoform X2 [Colletes latitarsis]|nr:L-selectin isoform X2 [Colletes gigas]XP_043263678.1 L-selectin isoform X2 [Colletes gigas]